jgi:hypothetical protein
MRRPLTLRQLVRRRNSIILIPIAIVAALFGALLWYHLLWFQSDNIWRTFESPQPMTLAQLSAMGNDAAGRWIELTIDVPAKHLLQTVTPAGRRGSSMVVLNYFALVRDFTSAKDKAIIVLAGRAELPTTFVARVVPEDSDNYKYVRRELYKWKSIEFPQAPVLLETPSLVGTRVIWALVIAITIAVAIMLWRILRGPRNPLRAAPIARLRKSVRAPEGLPALVAEIDRQLAGLDPTARRMGPILLPSWLAHVTPFSFSLISASDVIWVGPGRIVSIGGQRNEILIVTRYWRKHSVLTPANLIPDRLAAFHRWAPWAVIGADETMKASFGRPGWWLTGSKAKARLIAMIDKRREEILALRTAQPGPSD